MAFGLTWPGLELTIYRIRSEHTKYYNTDAVSRNDDITFDLIYYSDAL